MKTTGARTWVKFDVSFYNPSPVKCEIIKLLEKVRHFPTDRFGISTLRCKHVATFTVVSAWEDTLRSRFSEVRVRKKAEAGQAEVYLHSGSRSRRTLLPPPPQSNMARLRRKACIGLFLFTLFVFGTMMGLRTLKPNEGFPDMAPGLELLPMAGEKAERRPVSRDATASTGQAQPAGGNAKPILSNSGPDGTIFYDVHIFYYAWYGNPQMDGKYIHWDHILVPHWDPKIASSYPRGRHMPPEDIGSSFYPELSPYSSRDPDVLESHMEQIGSSAAGTLREIQC